MRNPRPSESGNIYPRAWLCREVARRARGCHTRYCVKSLRNPPAILQRTLTFPIARLIHRIHHHRHDSPFPMAYSAKPCTSGPGLAEAVLLRRKGSSHDLLKARLVPLPPIRDSSLIGTTRLRVEHIPVITRRGQWKVLGNCLCFCVLDGREVPNSRPGSAVGPSSIPRSQYTVYQIMAFILRAWRKDSNNLKKFYSPSCATQNATRGLQYNSLSRCEPELSSNQSESPSVFIYRFTCPPRTMSHPAASLSAPSSSSPSVTASKVVAWQTRIHRCRTGYCKASFQRRAILQSRSYLFTYSHGGCHILRLFFWNDNWRTVIHQRLSI
ncbi:hypothetical protein F5148DRAFT_736421 [Russula earlei]|uniref:Uncharacterized protein n=1 Tax=Russula earlei TaxID=71964 RepID=A0ACC0TTC0_9AGAM|nr:hypothetical protein F5148DRAFT_736421 [Russula earlei]